jgi:hypothetical protein
MADFILRKAADGSGEFEPASPAARRWISTHFRSVYLTEAGGFTCDAGLVAHYLQHFPANGLTVEEGGGRSIGAEAKSAAGTDGDILMAIRQDGSARFRAVSAAGRAFMANAVTVGSHLGGYDWSRPAHWRENHISAIQRTGLDLRVVPDLPSTSTADADHKARLVAFAAATAAHALETIGEAEAGAVVMGWAQVHPTAFAAVIREVESRGDVPSLTRASPPIAADPVATVADSFRKGGWLDPGFATAKARSLIGIFEGPLPTDPFDVDMVDTITGAVGYALRELRWLDEILIHDCQFREAEGVTIIHWSYDFDETNSSRPLDHLDDFPALSERYISEGSPVRKKDGKRLVEPSGYAGRPPVFLMDGPPRDLP